MMETHLAVFKGKRIRRTLHNDEWWFSIVDIVEVLTGTERPRKYWSDLKKKLSEEGYDELSEKIGQLKMQSPDEKYYETDCANTETMFRIIQSIPSPKAEPFKRWLAKAGYERVQEIENPELATCKDFLQVQIEGNRPVERKQRFYNLDVIISVGYRAQGRGLKP